MQVVYVSTGVRAQSGGVGGGGVPRSLNEIMKGGSKLRMRLLRILAYFVIPALLLGSTSLAIGGGRATDRSFPSTIGDNAKALREAIRSGQQVTVIVQLTDAALATYTGGVRGIGATKPARGRKLDKKSANALGYQRYLGEKRAAFRAYLRNNAASAVVEAEYDTTLNGIAITLSGRDLQAVLNAPGVKSVSMDREFRPAMNISRGLIGGSQIDDALTAADKGPAGQGMKVGIIDTGIEDTHPFFDPATYTAPAGFPIADNPSNVACTSAKVIVARAYPKPPGADSCIDTNGHGTHVAGTVAGNSGTTATVQGVAITGLSGVAHRAFLGNYNVFPNLQASARSVEIIRAIEDAVSDGMDVLNMSLGGGVHQPEQGDPLAQAVNSAAEAGVVVAVAAGNSGPGLFTVESPGNASGALTAAASTNPHFVGIPVTFGATEVPAALGQFGDFVPTLTAPLANWNNTAAGAANSAATQACSPASVSHSGQIVVIDRGTCTFTTKVRNAQNADAAAVLVVNNAAGDPVAMAQDGTTPVPTIDAAMIGLINRGTLRAAAATNTSATVDGTAPAEFVTSLNLTPGGATQNADIIAGFSSRGPVPFDERLKPDVSAPGVNVLSSTVDPLTPEFDWAFFQGTSMATPHLAGSAAVIKQLHPTWTPEQIKSALSSRAKRPVWDHVTGAAPVSAIVRGGGRVNLDTAKDVNVTFSPPNFSFGQVKPKKEAQSVSRPITFTNVTSSSLAWNTAPIPSCAVLIGGSVVTVATFTVSSTSGSVAAGNSVTVVVTATTVGGAPDGVLCSGDVTVNVGTQTTPPHRVPWILTHAKNALVPP